jgi:cytochrome c2
LVSFLSYLTITLYLLCLPAMGAQPQMCLGCHPSHYAERGTCITCHRGNPSSGRKNIAHHRLIAGRFARFTLGDTEEVREGKRLMELFACRRCHVSGDRGNRLATSLDTLLAARTSGEIAAAMRSPAKGMPDFRLAERQVVDLVNAICAGAKHDGGKGLEHPLVVHFEAGQKENEDVFTRKCGPCHRVLTERQGLLGAGDIGPNLSGLLSEFYPETFNGRENWTAGRLRLWLDNPRRFSRHALMRPVSLDPGELGLLKEIFLNKPRW